MISFLSFISENCDKLSGVAAGKTIDQIAKKHKVNRALIDNQLRMGIKIEMEHTKDRKVATKIAMDHLWERSDYYTKLKKYVEIGEDAPVNNAGGGNIAGLKASDPVVMKKGKNPWAKYMATMINGRGGTFGGKQS